MKTAALALLGLAAVAVADYPVSSYDPEPPCTDEYPVSTYVPEPASTYVPHEPPYPTAGYPHHNPYPTGGYPHSQPPVYPSATSEEPCEYTTEVVTAYTTYCPGPTEIVHGTYTYHVTEATTLTITECPCTLTRPVYSTVPPAPPVYSTYVASSVPAPAPTYQPAPTYPAAANGTTPASGTYPTSPAPIAQGAASSLTASGAALAGIVAIAAFLL